MTELQTLSPNCPICGTAVEADDETVCCERCHTPHHKDCWEYAEGCAIFACDSRGWRLPATITSPEEVSTAIEQWRSVFNGEWSAFSSMGIGVVLFSLYIILMNAPIFARQGLYLAKFLLFPSILSTAIGYAQLILAGRHAIEANEQLNGAIENKILRLKTPPPASITARMEMPFYQRTVDTLLTLMFWLTILISLLGLAHHLPITLPVTLITWLTRLGATAPIFVPIIWATRYLIRRRSATIAATRNRIEASFEKLKGSN